MALQSRSSYGGGGGATWPIKTELECLLAARQKLHKAVEKTQELGTQINGWENRLRMLRQRHAPLERALAPLQLQADATGGMSSRIERAMTAATSLLKMFNVMHGLERILSKEPQEDFDGYLAAVMQLEEARDYLKHKYTAGVRCLEEAVKRLELDASSNTDSHHLHHLQQSLVSLQAGGTTCSELDGGLLDMALRQLEGEFKRLVGEHGVVMWLPAIMPSEETTTTADDSSYTTTTDKDLQPSFAPDVMQKLHAILERVAADSNNHRHRACLQMYQETRSSLVRLSLQALQVQYLRNSTPELVDRVESEELQNMIGFWMQHLEVAVKVLYAGERRLACQVFKDLGQPVWAECVGKVAHAGMIAFLQFGEAVACSERAPEKLCGLLDMFDAMEKCAKSILRVFDGEMDGIRSRYRELQKQVVYGASKTFQEIARWIEVQNYPLAFDGGVTQLSSYVVNYLKYLVQEYSSPINKVLRIEHSWRSEDQPQEMDLSMWILQFMQALEQQVESRSKEHSNTALRHIFMMNNLYYICNRAKTSELGPLLGEYWLSNLSQKVEKHALRFQKEAWKPVLVHLSRDGLSLSSGGRSAARELVRQRLRSFAASFEEACLTQSKWIIAEEDLRVGAQVSVVQAVVPAYRSYLQNFGSFLDSQSSFPNKYVKYSPEMVEKMLGELFMAGRSNNGSDRHTPIEDHQV